MNTLSTDEKTNVPRFRKEIQPKHGHCQKN